MNQKLMIRRGKWPPRGPEPRSSGPTTSRARCQTVTSASQRGSSLEKEEGMEILDQAVEDRGIRGMYVLNTNVVTTI